jgi:acyl-CoA thioester hydrolase
MIELWRGCANAWECDELGHLNVRFYLAKAWEGVSDLADRIGMPDAFQTGTTATLRPADITIRYLGEVHPGAPLVIEGATLDIAEQSADIILSVRHAASGRIAAIFLMRLEHCVPAGGPAFEWPGRIRQALERFRGERPAEASPRSLDDGEPAPGLTLDQADTLGLPEIGRGRINPEDCDVFGVMMPEHLQGKVSNSVSNFEDAFPEQTAAHASGGGRIGGALLEGRIAIRRWPRAGQGYVIRSGLQSADRNVRKIVHWVFDTHGKLLWSMQGVAAIMDLDARKLVKADDRTLATLSAASKPGLTI